MTSDMTAAAVQRSDLTAHNEIVARWLREAADILQAQGVNPFRVAAYRRGADSVEAAGDLGELYARGGRAALDALPGIGSGIAAAIAEMLDTGRCAQLDRLRASVDPETLFRTVPGIGPELAARIHSALRIDTLEALEIACHDGRLRAVPGVGPRRAALIRAAVADLLGNARLRWTRRQQQDGEPPVSTLLEIDAEYRDEALRNALPVIAPRRFNPDHKRWLPVLHATRGAWHFTALYSNTARAHELNRTSDWVVLYFYNESHGERSRTIVTESHGPLVGRRVVRGREAECEEHYAKGMAPQVA